MIDIGASLQAASRQNAEGCVKISEDLDRYRAVIERSRPDGVIEVGTFSGKSALFFARTAGAPVLTIDCHPQVDADTEQEWSRHRVSDLIGMSLSAATAWNVREWLRRFHVEHPMVVLDGDHSHRTVLDEMNLYGRLVRPGGYMVVEDTIVRWMPSEWKENGGPYEGSPLDAVDEFMGQNHAHWELDAEVEGMSPVTQFPSGWLRRTGDC